MKLSTLIDALRTLQIVNDQIGADEPVVYVQSADGSDEWEPLAELRCLTPSDETATTRVATVHLVAKGEAPFWPDQSQFHIRADGSTRSIIPSVGRDVVTPPRQQVA